MENIYLKEIEIKNLFVKPVTKTVLLYNMKNDSRMRKLRKYLDSNDIRIICVRKENYMDPLGFILQRPGFSPAENKGAGFDFSDEMMVMDGFEREDLDSLLSFFTTAAIKRISLKAMITRHNIHWSSAALYMNLREEHMRFTR